MGAKKKVLAVSALTIGGIAGATGTAYAAQGGVTTEAPGGTNTAVAAKPTKSNGGDAKTKPAAVQQSNTSATKASAPAPTISQAEKTQARSTSGGGQGGVTTELPSDRKVETKQSASRTTTSGAEAQATELPKRPQASTEKSGTSDAKTHSTPSQKPAPSQASTPSVPTQHASPTESSPAATAQQSSKSAAQQATTTSAATTNTAATGAATQASQPVGDTYTDVSATSGGQGGVATELPAKVDATEAETTSDDATVQAPADDTRTDYTERVEAASQTPSSGTYVPADPIEASGQVATYSTPRDNGAEVGATNGDVSTGTAVQFNDTTSYVSNTTTGGGEQATAAQTWDASNGNYNATWATTGGVSGAGGFSATNEQTAPNVGSASVDGQWSSPDGASSVTVTGGATLQNYGVHDASGSVEISTPIGDMSFAF